MKLIEDIKKETQGSHKEYYGNGSPTQVISGSPSQSSEKQELPKLGAQNNVGVNHIPETVSIFENHGMSDYRYCC